MASEYSVGVEEEYQLVDPGSGELRSRARDVLATEWAGQVEHEAQETMLEVGTRICASAGEVSTELRRLRFHVGSAAAAQELAIVAAGVHPFSGWRGHRISPGERYRKLAERFGRVIRTDHAFGMHIHVQVPAEVDRIRVLNALRVYVPHLLALSASSPIYEGDDTGYASYRCILNGRLPFSGVPPRFQSRVDHQRTVKLLLRSGAIPDEWTLYWSIRPHPTYPTLEFRTTDVCPSVDDAVAITALVRTMVVAAVEGTLAERPLSGLSRGADDVVLAANEWHAIRHGLHASFVDPRAKEGAVPARDAIRALLETVAPVAERMGDGAQLAHLETVLARGNGADRIREVAEGCKTLTEVVAWLARETLLGSGLDRRTEQRGSCV